MGSDITLLNAWHKDKPDLGSGDLEITKDRPPMGLTSITDEPDKNGSMSDDEVMNSGNSSVLRGGQR